MSVHHLKPTVRLFCFLDSLLRQFTIIIICSRNEISKEFFSQQLIGKLYIYLDTPTG